MEEDKLLKLIIGKLHVEVNSNLDCASIGENLYVNCVFDSRIYHRFKDEPDESKKNTIMIEGLLSQRFNTDKFKVLLAVFYSNPNFYDVADNMKLAYCILKHEETISDLVNYQDLVQALQVLNFFNQNEERELKAKDRVMKHVFMVLKNKQLLYFKAFLSCLKQLDYNSLVSNINTLFNDLPCSVHVLNIFKNFLQKVYTLSSFNSVDKLSDCSILDDVFLTLAESCKYDKHCKRRSSFIDEYTERLENASVCPERHPYSKIVAENCRVILIKGYPGSGKTTLAKQLCTMWVKDQLLQGFTHVIFLQLKQVEIANITSLNQVIKLYIESLSSEITKEIEKQRGKGFLIILEGWDELQVKRRAKGFYTRLIQGDILPEAVVLVTSRPSAICKIPQIPLHQIEILGFTQQQLHQYINCHFEKYENKAELVVKFYDELQRLPSLKSLLFIPINLNVCLYVFERNGFKLPQTLTCIYETLIVAQLNHRNHTPVSKLKDLPKFGEVYTMLIRLAKMAYHHLEESKAMFDNAVIQKYCVYEHGKSLEYFDGMGLLQVSSDCYTQSSKWTYRFIHKTIEELLAAWFISEQPMLSQVEELKKIFNKSEFQMVWIFYAGLTKFKSISLSAILPNNCSQQIILKFYSSISALLSKTLSPMFKFDSIKSIVTNYFSKKQYSKSISRFVTTEFQITLAAAVMEAQNPQFCRDLHNSFLFHGNTCWFHVPESDIMPQTLASLSYFIAHSGKKWMIHCRTLDKQVTDNLLKYLICSEVQSCECKKPEVYSTNTNTSIYTLNVTCSYSIIPVVKTQKCLQWLILSHCEIINANFINLLTATLMKNNCVKMLHLLDCDLTRTNLKAIANMFKKNRTLEWIGLKGNIKHMTENDVVLLLQTIHNYNHTIYMLMLDKSFDTSSKVQSQIEMINHKRQENKKLYLTTVHQLKSSKNAMPGRITTGDGKSIKFGENSVRIVCPNCKEEMRTNLQTDLQPGSLVWAMIMVLLCFPMLWPLIFLLLCCVDQTKDVCHSCSKCNTQLGIYEML